MRKLPLIFVVDDDPLILKLAESKLKALKMEVMCFNYGEEFFDELNLGPDLIILDYIFVNGDQPVLSGLEILKKIRLLNHEVPVIILSGQESGSVALNLIKLGIEEYIIKENNFIDELKEAVINALQNK